LTKAAVEQQFRDENKFSGTIAMKDYEKNKKHKEKEYGTTRLHKIDPVR